MARYIDAEKLLAECEKAEKTMEKHGQEYSYSFMSSSQEISTEWYFVEELINNAPTADVRENVRGEWVVLRREQDNMYDHICSACAETFCTSPYTKGRHPFCPHCGAAMEVEEEEDEH